jgi:hypothetical protein
MSPIIETNKLERIQIRGAEDPSVRWNGAFAVYGSHGTTQSSTSEEMATSARDTENTKNG